MPAKNLLSNTSTNPTETKKYREKSIIPLHSTKM